MFLSSGCADMDLQFQTPYEPPFKDNNFFPAVDMTY